MQETVTEKLNQARELKRRFKLEETIAVLKECLEIDPSCLIASAQVGLCFLLLGKADEALPFLKETFEKSGRSDRPVGAYLAACLTATGETERAKEILAVLQSDTFSAAETFMLTAEMMSEKKQHEYAVHLIDALSVLFSQDDFFTHPVNHYRLIRVLSRAGLVDIASQLADALVENYPDCWEAAASEASVAIAEGKYEEAYLLTVEALKNGGASYPLLAAQQHWLAMNK